MDNANKKIFPGGQTEEMRAQALEKKRKAKEEAKARKTRQRAFDKANKKAEKKQHKDFLRAIGPMARLVMVRRSLQRFAYIIMAELCLGSGLWLINNTEQFKKDKTSYVAALKNTHDVRNLFDDDKWDRRKNKGTSAFETVATILVWALAGLVARRRITKDQDIAQATLTAMGMEGCNWSGWNEETKDTMRRLFRLADCDASYYNELIPNVDWELHPICRQVIEKMARENPVFFNRLLNGNTRFVTGDYAMTVVRGHLKAHPEDFEKVLAVYNQETLPKSLVRKYGAKTR